MIDFEKLRTAHELCCDTESYYFDIALGMDNGCIALYDANNNAEQFICNPYDLDDLINKLKELTKPEPKYKIGESVWYQDLGKPFGANIVFVSNEQYEIDDSKNNNGKTWFTETELYPTKQALIEAQIEYWSSQLDTRCVLSPDIQINQHEVDIDRCQHESSRILRLSDGGDGLCHYDVKCKKCGEFYR